MKSNPYKLVTSEEAKPQKSETLGEALAEITLLEKTLSESKKAIKGVLKERFEKLKEKNTLEVTVYNKKFSVFYTSAREMKKTNWKAISDEFAVALKLSDEVFEAAIEDNSTKTKIASSVKILAKKDKKQ